jgi:predicted RND superfamily exporter protein
VSQAELLKKLDELHKTLEASPTVDKEVAPALRQVATDIQRALEGQPDSADKELSRRLNDMIAKLETEHPHITAILSQVTELLASIGI